jgi:hypothetical protein
MWPVIVICFDDIVVWVKVNSVGTYYNVYCIVYSIVAKGTYLENPEESLKS